MDFIKFIRSYSFFTLLNVSVIVSLMNKSQVTMATRKRLTRIIVLFVKLIHFITLALR